MLVDPHALVTKAPHEPRMASQQKPIECPCAIITAKVFGFKTLFNNFIIRSICRQTLVPEILVSSFFVLKNL
jgi:hypothetical protein